MDQLSEFLSVRIKDVQAAKQNSHMLRLLFYFYLQT